MFCFGNWGQPQSLAHPACCRRVKNSSRLRSHCDTSYWPQLDFSHFTTHDSVDVRSATSGSCEHIKARRTITTKGPHVEFEHCRRAEPGKKRPADRRGKRGQHTALSRNRLRSLTSPHQPPQYCPGLRRDCLPGTAGPTYRGRSLAVTSREQHGRTPVRHSVGPYSRSTSASNKKFRLIGGCLGLASTYWKRLTRTQRHRQLVQHKTNISWSVS